MSSFDDKDFNHHRFSIHNPVLHTERYLFDVSNIPVGDLHPFQSLPGESTPDSQELIRRNLFPELSMFPPDIDKDTQINVVTMGTATLPPVIVPRETASPVIQRVLIVLVVLEAKTMRIRTMSTQMMKPVTN